MNQMLTLTPLEAATEEFFKLYWNKDKIREPRPQWSSWNLDGVPPEAEMGGCYAIYDKDAVLLYIGVAITEGKNATKTGKKYGLLNRLLRHVIRKEPSSTRYVPSAKKTQWQHITCIRLIGFPEQHRHLAAALEVYLINRLDTVVNAQSRWREAQATDA